MILARTWAVFNVAVGLSLQISLAALFLTSLLTLGFPVYSCVLKLFPFSSVDLLLLPWSLLMWWKVVTREAFHNLRIKFLSFNGPVSQYF